MSSGPLHTGFLRRRRAAALLVASLVVAAVAAGLVLGARSGPSDDRHRAAADRFGRSAAEQPRPSIRPTAVSPSAPGAHRAPREPVPILFYHVVNRPPPGTPNPELWVSREDFAAQVNALAQRGYHAVTLQQAYDAWHRGGLLPSKPIVFSFDDGYHSQYTNALPILHARSWPGVLNLQVDLLKTDLKPPEIRAMIAAGWEVDAHTISHPDLTTLSAERLRREIAGSRDEIRRRFGVPVNFFCYPAGRFDPAVEAAVREAGFIGATTTQPGAAAPGQSPFELRRIRVNGSDGVASVENAVQAAQGSVR